MAFVEGPAPPHSLPVAIPQRSSACGREKRRLVVGVFKRLAFWLSIPVVLAEFFEPETGREYGVGFFRKLALALRMILNSRRVPTASTVMENLIIATEILKIPKCVMGCVVECGTFKGGSAANLSLVCELCTRSLEIFDSFQGLPEPSGADRRHVLLNAQEVHAYSRGDWIGGIEEVRNNIAAYGKLGVCNFHPGYFEHTLPEFKEPCVLAFVDVDLRDSLATCVRHLWPLLRDGSYLFSHEAPHTEISSLFFSEDWWRQTGGCGAPGLVGAGTGLGLSPAAGGFRSDLGYAVKNPDTMAFQMSIETGTPEFLQAAKHRTATLRGKVSAGAQ
jgi:O-methyltransferase